MDSYYITNDLLGFLGLDLDKSYTYDYITKIIKKKKFNMQDVLDHFPSFSTCLCGNCKINKSQFLYFVDKNCIIINTKPNCLYYEYNQKPIKINNFVFNT